MEPTIDQRIQKVSDLVWRIEKTRQEETDSLYLWPVVFWKLVLLKLTQKKKMQKLEQARKRL